MSHPLKIEVHRVGRGGPFRAARLGGDELRFERAGEARDDLVLHFEQVGEAIETRCRLPSGHSARQVPPDLLEVDGLARVSECRIAPDHEGADDPR